MTAKKTNPIATNTAAVTPAPPKEDNWEHRSEGMRCKTCISYVPKKTKVGVAELGRCRRNAPTMRGFPVVFPTDWCGAHKIDENKI